MNSSASSSLTTSLSTPLSMSFYGSASGIVEQFIRALGKKFQAEMDALQIDLDLSCSELLPLWKSELGHIIRGFNAKSHSTADRTSLFSQFLLLLSSTRALDGRSFDISTSHPVLLGHTKIRAGAYHLAVHPDGIELDLIEADFIHAQRFVKKSGLLTFLESDSNAAFIDVSGVALGIVADDYWADFDSYQALDGRSMESMRLFSDAARRALEILFDVDAAYGLWVACVVRYLIMMKTTCGDRVNKSRSILFRFGGIEINPDVDDTEIMELLVHECSHQYYHMLSLMHPLHRDVSTLHYSAATESQRPMERLLIAYHAQVNISIFLDRVFDSVAPSQKSSINRLTNIGIHKLNSLNSQLRRHAEAGLSEHGLELYKTLEKAARAHNFIAKGEIC